MNEPKEIESKKEQNETNEFSFVIDNSLEEIYIKNADLGKDDKNNSEDNQKDERNKEERQKEAEDLKELFLQS
jgi:hypothetical protein